MAKFDDITSSVEGMKFPLKGLKKEDEVFYNSNNLLRFKLISNLVLGLKRLFTDFQVDEEAADGSDLYLRTQLYREMISTIFPSDYFFVDSKYTIFITKAVIDELAKFYKPDSAIFFKPHSDSVALRKLANAVPVSVAEYQKYCISPFLKHKDEIKVAVQLTVCLLTWVTVLMPFGPQVCEKLCLPGLLLGACDIAFFSVTPRFGQPIIVDGKKVYPVTVLFKTSKKDARFSIYNTGVYKYSSDNPEYAESKEAFEFVAKMHESILKKAEEIEEDAFEAMELEKFEEAAEKEYEKTFDTKSALPPTKSIKEILALDWNGFPEKMANLKAIDELLMDWKDKDVMDTTIFALHRFSLWVKTQAQFIEDNFHKLSLEDKSRKLADLHFKFSASKKPFVPETGDPDQVTPKKGGTLYSNFHSSPMAPADDIQMAMIGLNFSEKFKLDEWRKPYFWHTADNVPLVSILKRFNEHEPQIYQLPVIRQSNFFARFVKYESLSTSPEDGAIITLRAETCTLSELTAEIMSQLRVHPQWFASSLLVHITTALKELHDAGYVHSNVGPENICFNVHERCWKLIDFGNAYPLKQSIETRRTLDNSQYLSWDARKTGILKPIDDFKALAKVFCYGFPAVFQDCNLEQSYAFFMTKVLDADEASKKFETVWRPDKWWVYSAMLHHKTICQRCECPDDTTVEMFNVDILEAAN